MIKIVLDQQIFINTNASAIAASGNQDNVESAFTNQGAFTYNATDSTSCPIYVDYKSYMRINMPDNTGGFVTGNAGPLVLSDRKDKFMYYAYPEFCLNSSTVVNRRRTYNVFDEENPMATAAPVDFRM